MHYTPNVRVIDCMMVETGSYNQAVQRSYTANARHDTLDALMDATRGGTRITPGDLSGVASRILMPSTEPSSKPMIINGWETHRLRFLMKVEHSHYQGGGIVQFIAGYTDYVGISHGGHLDPNMRLYFNSVITTSTVNISTPYGPSTIPMIRANDHLLTSKPNMINIHQNLGAQPQPHLMRPEDVLQTVGLQVLGDMDTYIDPRSNFMTNGMHKSTRKNLDPANYLSRTLNASKKALSLADYENDYSAIMENAASYVRENDISTDVFLSTLIRNTGFTEGQFVTWGELNALSPGLEHITKVIRARGNPQSFGRVGTNSGEYWHSTTNETIAATILSNSIPTLMMDCMLTHVEFACHNMLPNGEIQLIFTGPPYSFAGEQLDLSEFQTNFMHRFVHEVFPVLSHGGMFGINVDVKMDILGDSQFGISIDNQPQVVYTSPTFADGLFAPVWAGSSDNLRTFAWEIGNLTNHMESGHGDTVYAPSTSTPTKIMLPTGGGMKDFGV